MYALGIDLGSSSVKVSVVDVEGGKVFAAVQIPVDGELPIRSENTGWAEQDPELWWESVCTGIQMAVRRAGVPATDIKTVGIAYQMHGLVAVDKNHRPLRDAIIWCDSRAVETGLNAVEHSGRDIWLRSCLNEPGNFTASKLAWVKSHEPETYNNIFKVMLPGDFIAMKLTGRICTTVGGLSQGILWDFRNNEVSKMTLEAFGLNPEYLPDIVSALAPQGEVSSAAAAECGLAAGTIVSYRAGDQPNNALSLGVMEPGAIAATCGTSGVVYGITDDIDIRMDSRLNAFAHVNHTAFLNRIGVLLCINGAGIQHAWMKRNVAPPGSTYEQVEAMMGEVQPGCDGLMVIPFGNGAERMFDNRYVGGRILNMDFNRHARVHLLRAAVEGVAFAFVYGLKLMRSMGMNTQLIRVGNDNLFQSSVFSETVASCTGCSIEVYDTTGATGAAYAAAYGGRLTDQLMPAGSLHHVRTFHPLPGVKGIVAYYEKWEAELQTALGGMH